jgi:small-conductance mechanosensitive channel
VADQTLAYARELAARDSTLAAAIDDVAWLRARVRATRDEAGELLGATERLPAERTGAQAALERSEAELVARRDALTAAERELAARASPERKLAAEQARMAHARAAEDRDAAARVIDEIDHRATAMQVRAGQLERETAELVPRLASVSGVQAPGEPGPGLSAQLAWAGRADSALLLAGSALSAERDRVVREANELAAVALGELPVPAGVGAIVQRLEKS